MAVVRACMLHVACCSCEGCPGPGVFPSLCADSPSHPIPSHPSAARSRGLAQCFMSVRAASSGRTALTPYERELLPSLRTVRACANTAESPLSARKATRLSCEQQTACTASSAHDAVHAYMPATAPCRTIQTGDGCAQLSCNVTAPIRARARLV